MSVCPHVTTLENSYIFLVLKFCQNTSALVKVTIAEILHKDLHDFMRLHPAYIT